MKKLLFGFGLCLSLCAPLVGGPYLMEKLGRGAVVIRPTAGSAYISWRLLGTEYTKDIAFNLYRSTDGAPAVKLNDAPLTATTDFTDTAADFAKLNVYSVRPVVDGVERAADGEATLPANAPARQYLSIPLQIPAPGRTSTGENYTYHANDCSVGDLDGDGEYEVIVKWDPSNSKGSSQEGLTGRQILDAYKLDGTRLWRIDVGPNIRSGPSFTQFMVYDLDGDNRAELVIKTADGTVDGLGQIIGDPTADWTDLNPSSATYGKVATGPEYLSVFDGPTGKVLATAPYIPGRDPINGWGGVGGNGGNDSELNRGDAMLALVAYLDGSRPSVVMCRGFYGRSVLAAWDYRDGQLTSRWVFDSELPPWKEHPITYAFPAVTDPATRNRLSTFSGQGGHVAAADVDGDGKQEVIYHAMTVDDNGLGLYSTGLRHGDALHVSDLIPSRPGLEVFTVHENESPTDAFQGPAASVHDARTGEVLWGVGFGADAGRGMAADI
ncbi:MAG TPA: hypothetical protein VHF69_08640, partial [Candidatus Synoicihabitans sp.]|nr:hypothetical protein [Candidatus Synoicihabitans sp.]